VIANKRRTASVVEIDSNNRNGDVRRVSIHIELVDDIRTREERHRFSAEHENNTPAAPLCPQVNLFEREVQRPAWMRAFRAASAVGAVGAVRCDKQVCGGGGIRSLTRDRHGQQGEYDIVEHLHWHSAARGLIKA